jgi:hypothetical protein
MPPFNVMVPVDVSVQVAPVVVKDAQGVSVPLNVIVGEPELLSTIAASAGPGGKLPPVPPEVVDQLVVEEVSHVPLPPTQYTPPVRIGKRAIAPAADDGLLESVVDRVAEAPADACNSSTTKRPAIDPLLPELNLDVVPVGVENVAAGVAPAPNQLTTYSLAAIVVNEAVVKVVVDEVVNAAAV